MADFKTGSCVAVADGGVGESGASSFLLHTVGAATPKTMVLRTVESSLCQNTGAVAMLVVNGQPVAQGDMTGVGNCDPGGREPRRRRRRHHAHGAAVQRHPLRPARRAERRAGGVRSGGLLIAESPATGGRGAPR